MKQIIERYKNGKISGKYYLNHLDQLNGLDIDYYTNGKLCWKNNYINNKLFGLNIDYDNNKPYQIVYHL